MNIESFKNSVGGGVRTALFRVGGRIGGSGSDELLTFLVTASSLPQSSLQTISAPFRGRDVKLPGSRVFGEEWSITILSDNDMSLRSKFERWVEDLNGAETNIARRDIDLSNTTDFPNWSIDQLDRNGDPVKSYTMFYCFPTAVSAIQNTAGDEGLASFDVSLAYSYFTTSDVNIGYGLPGTRTEAR